jgi:hypothetical protein
MLDHSTSLLPSATVRTKTLATLNALTPLLLLLFGLEVSRTLWRLLEPTTGPISFGGPVYKHAIISSAIFLFTIPSLIATEQLFPTSSCPSGRSYAMGLSDWILPWFLSYFVGLVAQFKSTQIGATPHL